MSRETEKFNRALQRFLNDNPDIDFEKAKDEFIKMYNSGEYKIDDDFSKADDLFEEALKLEDSNQVIEALKQVLKICPTHYEAKGQLILMETKDNKEKTLKLQNLLNEIKLDLEKNYEISFDKIERSLWLNVEARSYLRNLFKLMLIYAEVDDFDNALKSAKELLKLDPENHQNQTLFYLDYLLEKKKYEEVLKESERFYKDESQTKYLFISLLAAIFKNDDELMDKFIKDIAKYNLTYLCFLIGVINLEEEDYNQIFSESFVEIDSFEDAARTFFCLNKVIFKNIDAINVFAEKKGVSVVGNLDPSKYGMELLFIMQGKREAKLDEVFQYIKNITDNMDFAKLKSKDREFVRKEMIKLKNKRYLDYHNSKYYLTYLGYSVLRFLIGEDINDNN